MFLASARISAPRWRFSMLVAALLLIGQFGVFLHQAEHHLRPDLLAGDDCPQCQFANAMTAAPAPPVPAVPAMVFVEAVIVAAITAPAGLERPQRPQPRAPPSVLPA